MNKKMCCNQYMKSYDSAFFLLHFAVLFFREGKMKKKFYYVYRIKKNKDRIQHRVCIKEQKKNRTMMLKSITKQEYDNEMKKNDEIYLFETRKESHLNG